MPPLPQIGNVSVKCGFVYLNDRIAPDAQEFFQVPNGTALLITDIVVQNRAPGDGPVGAADFTRFAITSPNGSDVFFHVVGNDTLNLHFTTGILVSGDFRFYNVVNSTAPFVEFHITGRLQSAS